MVIRLPYGEAANRCGCQCGGSQRDVAGRTTEDFSCFTITGISFKVQVEQQKLHADVASSATQKICKLTYGDSFAYIA